MSTTATQTTETDETSAFDTPAHAVLRKLAGSHAETVKLAIAAVMTDRIQAGAAMRVGGLVNLQKQLFPEELPSGKRKKPAGTGAPAAPATNGAAAKPAEGKRRKAEQLELPAASEDDDVEEEEIEESSDDEEPAEASDDDDDDVEETPPPITPARVGKMKAKGGKGKRA
jgi:hypothetical protein